MDMLLEELVPGENLETGTVEFKGMIEEGAGKELKWLRTLAAFANTQGGRLYIGVDDKSHKVMALDHATADKATQMVHRQVREKVDPPIDYEIEAIPYPGVSPTRYVLCVRVQHSARLPVGIHSNGMLGVFVRRFGRTESATSEQVRDMVLQSENVPYDQPLTERAFSRDDFSVLLEFHRERAGANLTDKELVSLGFMAPDGRLSKGALLFADACHDEVTRIVATKWPGDTKGSDVVLASEAFAGDLISSIQFAQDFISNHSTNGFRKTAGSRVDYVSFPPRSVTEGVVNAVGHRNYFLQGSQVEVDVFADRLEITSPGSLLGVPWLDREHDIARIVPRRRNQVICDVLAACRLMEEKGSGFDKIQEDYAGKGPGYRPFVSAGASSFTLTLPDLTFAGGVIGDGNDSPAVATRGVLDVHDGLKVLSYCYRQDRTAAQIAGRLGITPSTYFRKSVLAALVSQGYLLERKEGRTSVYTANPLTVFVLSSPGEVSEVLSEV